MGKFQGGKVNKLKEWLWFHRTNHSIKYIVYPWFYNTIIYPVKKFLGLLSLFVLLFLGCDNSRPGTLAYEQKQDLKNQPLKKSVELTDTKNTTVVKIGEWDDGWIMHTMYRIQSHNALGTGYDRVVLVTTYTRTHTAGIAVTILQ